MASPVASSRTTEPSAVRIHLWRVLSMLAALVALVGGLVIILTSAA